MFLRVPTGQVELICGRFAIEQAQIERLEKTLSMLPQEHLRGLRYIGIRDNPHYEGGSTNIASSSPASPRRRRQYWIMLDIDGFDPRQRPVNHEPGGLNYTLLHEMGHVVDWSTHSFRWMHRHDPAGWRLITGRYHEGATVEENEKFADTYADLFFYPQGRRGRSDDCVRAILRSPAFTRLHTFVRLPNGWTIPRARHSGVDEPPR